MPKIILNHQSQISYFPYSSLDGFKSQTLITQTQFANNGPWKIAVTGRKLILKTKLFLQNSILGDFYTLLTAPVK